MARKSAKAKGNVDRLLNPQWGTTRTARWTVWDRTGRRWYLRTESIPRPRAEELYFNPTVQVAVAAQTRGLTWIEAGERRARWSGEIEERAFGDWAWETNGSLPFMAMEFFDEGDSLLLFYDSD